MADATATQPMWEPNAGTISRAHVTTLMARAQVDDFPSLHRWSVEERDRFWAIVIDELGIVFNEPPSAIRGSSDVEHPDWLSGARLNIVDSCLSGPSEAPAIILRGATGVEMMSIGALRRLVARFAAGYRDAGYGPGDAVAIAMPMTVEAVAAYLGTIAAGGVVVSIADSFAPDEIATRLGITQPVAIVTQDVIRRSGRTLPMYGKCVDASPVTCIVVDTGGDVDLRGQDRAWDEFLGEDDVFAALTRPGSAHTNILFSSGTTGEPKAIPWTQLSPIKAAMDGRYHQDIHRGDVVAWPTNLGWMMGPWLIYASLLNGAAMALYDDAPTTRGFVEFVRDAGVTVLGLVPSIVSAWRSGALLADGDWTRVRVLSSTGEASNADDYRWLSDVAGGVPMIEYCGGTEIGGGYLTGTVVQPAHPGRFTTPALGIDLVLVEDGQESDLGEVFLIGPSIGMSEELLNRDHHDVYFAGTPSTRPGLRRHGDQIQRLGDGTYRALGRVDDTMNLGGIKVSSAEIEGVIGVVAGVTDVAAVAVPPPGGGPDRLVVFVVSDGDLDVEATRNAMQGEIRRHLNPLFRIHEVVPVDTLPRTASQKLMRRTLRAEYDR
jgi:acetyl-CoA synthetase